MRLTNDLLEEKYRVQKKLSRMVGKEKDLLEYYKAIHNIVMEIEKSKNIKFNVKKHSHY